MPPWQSRARVRAKQQRGRSLGNEPGGAAGGLRGRRSSRPTKPVFADRAATIRPRARYSPQSRSGRGYRAGFVRPHLAPRPQLRPRSRHRHGVARPHRAQPMLRCPAAARAGGAARRQDHGKPGGSGPRSGRTDRPQPRCPAAPGLPGTARGQSAPESPAGLLSRADVRRGGGPGEGPARHSQELDPAQPDPAQGLHGPMKYEHPELRERLAAEYALGTLRGLARRRFERVLAADAALRDLVQDWELRLNLLAESAPAVAPPARVWERILQRLGPAPAREGLLARWWNSLGFWRGAGLLAMAATAALALYIALTPTPGPSYIAVLIDADKTPILVAKFDADTRELSVRSLQAPAADPAHSRELWMVA